MRKKGEEKKHNGKIIMKNKKKAEIKMENRVGVLIVDDNKELAQNLDDILKEKGYRTAIALDGQSAIKLCQNNIFDLALVDLKLPDMDGLKLIDKISNVLPTLECIIITGFGTLENAAEAVGNRRIVGFEVKPLIIERLLFNIQQATKRRHLEDAFLKSESRLRSIFRGAPIGIGLVSNRVILQVNEKMCEMVGYTADELVGKNASIVFPSKEEYEYVGKVKYDQNENKGTGTVETRFKRKDGKIIDVLLSSTPIDPKDLSAGITFTAMDITKRKKAEEEQEWLNEELVRKNRELEQIIYATSHDLRSPLVNIQGFNKELEYSIEALKDHLKVKEISKQVKKNIFSIIKEEIPESMKYIQKSISKMDLLLSGLLQLSRIGRQTLHLVKLDMNKLIAGVVYTFEFLIKEKGINLKISELPKCIGDKSQINQVFSNILDNAIKYLDPNKPGLIKISGKIKKDRSVYCVADNGIGISQKDQEMIFGIFHQIDPRKSEGEGLGLTIVNRIVDRHNGKIWVKSEPGKGSKFFISLPMG